MPQTSFNSVLFQVRKLTVESVSEDVPDSFLLQRFAVESDEAAFAQLVRRHGPMVLGVCRRVLRDSHAADDVFQATFLALARRPKSIRNETSLACWLHQVAHRIARRVCFTTARRRAHELQSAIAAVADPRDEMSWREMCEVLDLELQALPEMFRAPLVLCYLEGLTRDEAAQQLGWTAGAVKGRLERGREMLRQRLTRRGITVNAALLGILMTQSSTSAVNDSLNASTVCMAQSFVTGQTAELPPAAALLADGVIRTLTPTRIKAIALALLICAVAGVGVWAYGAATTPIEATRSPEPNARIAEPVPSKAAASETVRADQFGDLLPAGTLARMGTVSLRHGSSVFFVSFLSDGKQVVSAGEDGLVRLWDVATGKEVRCFGTPITATSSSLAVALSWNGKTLATCDCDAGVRLWDTETGLEMGQVKSLKTVYTLTFSPDGKTLAAASHDGLVVLWDLGKNEELNRLDGRPDFSNMDPTGRLAPGVTARIESLVHRSNGPAGGGQGIWNERYHPHLEFSSDGKTLLAATMGFRKPTIRSTARLWDVVTGKELRQIEEGDKTFLASAALSHNGKAVGWADGSGNVHIIETATGKELHSFPGESPKDNPLSPLDGLSSGRMRTRFAFDPRGQTLITQTMGSQELVVWDLTSGKELRRLGNRTHLPTWPAGTSTLLPPGLAFSPDGKTLAAAGDGNAATLFDLNSGQEIHPRGGHRAAITAVRYSPDGKSLTSLSGDGSLRIWETDKGKEIGMARLPDVTLTTALSSDARLVASSRGDGKVRLTEAATGKERGIIPMSIKGAVRLALSPDCKTLAVGEDDSSPTVWLYDVATGKETKALKPAGVNNELPSRGGLVVPFRTAPSPVFSLDGKQLAAPGRGTLDIWEVATGRQISHLSLPENRAVRAAAFTPDGQSIALSLIGWLQQACNDEGVIPLEDLEDETVVLWDIATGKELHIYGRKPTEKKCCAFEGAPPGFALPIPRTDPVLLAISSDGRLLAHNRGRDVSVWDVGSAKELGRLKGHQGAVLAGAFSPDSKTLTTTSADTTALVWDLSTLSRR